MTSDRSRGGSEHERGGGEEEEQGQGEGLFSGPDRLRNMMMVHRHRQRVMRKKAEGGEAEKKEEAGGEVSQPGEPAEQEADAVADKVAGQLHGEGEAHGDEGQPAGKEQAPAIGAKLKPGAISLAPKPNANQLPLPGIGGDKDKDKKKDAAAADKKGELAPHADVKHVAVEDGKYVIKPEYRGCIREKFYATKYNAAVCKWKARMLATPKSKGGLAHETDPTQYEFNGKFYKNEGTTVASIGHEKPPVATHWNETGHNTAQPARITYFNGEGAPETNLIIQPASMNKSEGAQKGERYKFDVGPNFKGPG